MTHSMVLLFSVALFPGFASAQQHRKAPRNTVGADALPRVATNVAALLLHRPTYIRKLSGLRDLLGEMIRHAAKRDQAGYRRSLAKAIKITEAMSPQGRSAINSREDVLAVLRAMQSGNGDLRNLPIHRRDYREEDSDAPELVGLPNACYMDAAAPKRRGKKRRGDDQSRFWQVGTRVKGTRGADVHVSINGTVTESSRSQLVVKVLERWRTKQGRNIRAPHIWVFKRKRKHAKAGAIGFSLIDCRPPKGRNHISGEAGDLVLRASTLSGDYQYDWRSGDGKLHRAGGRRSFELHVVR